jgi:hypothetical protein
VELLKKGTRDEIYEMATLDEKKQKFLETLLTLGALLAVFLGFVVEKTGALLNQPY